MFLTCPGSWQKELKLRLSTCSELKGRNCLMKSKTRSKREPASLSWTVTKSGKLEKPMLTKTYLTYQKSISLNYAKYLKTWVRKAKIRA